MKTSLPIGRTFLKIRLVEGNGNPCFCDMNIPNVLNKPLVPGRIDVEETAKLTGFPPSAIPILVSARLLKPLGGNLPPNAIKYFATVQIVECCQSPEWLSKATRAVV